MPRRNRKRLRHVHNKAKQKRNRRFGKRVHIRMNLKNHKWKLKDVAELDKLDSINELDEM
jgi:hypothetical protein